jgi:hypothetical protein
MATVDHTPKGRGYDTSFGYFHHANDYWTEHVGAYVDLYNETEATDWAGPAPAFAPLRDGPVRKTPLLSHFYLKTIILPRQAREEYRENSKRVRFLRAMGTTAPARKATGRHLAPAG